jgi:hypothetical protein
VEHKESGLGEGFHPFPTVTALPLMSDLSNPAADNKHITSTVEYYLLFITYYL